MPVGDKYAFLQFSDSVSQSVNTAGATVTFSTGAQPDPAVRIHNMSTATVWIGMGTRSTSSAAVTGDGIMISPANNQVCVQVFRTGGQTTLAAFTLGATQTTSILVIGGEGVL